MNIPYTQRLYIVQYGTGVSIKNGSFYWKSLTYFVSSDLRELLNRRAEIEIRKNYIRKWKR